VFWTGPVYELVEAAPDFDVLEARDFIRRRPGSCVSFGNASHSARRNLRVG